MQLVRAGFLLLAVHLLGNGQAFAAKPTFAGPPPPYFVDEAKLPFDALPGTDTTRLFGIHKGAAYRIEVPSGWNGDLVVHAHGFRGFCDTSGAGACELTVDNPPIRRYLIERGYAWAASSYAQNGYQVGQGVKDTHALAKFFNGKVGKPNRTYIMGFSMGGHITGVSIEQYPNAYDGALPMCGVMGDNELFDYFLDVNMVAATLAGQEDRIVFPLPEGFDYLGSVVPDIKAGLGPAFPFVPNAQGVHFKNATALLSGGFRPWFEHGWWFWNVLAPDFLFSLFGGDPSIGAAPGSVPSNIDTLYQLDADPSLTPGELDLNNRAPRTASDPQARHPNGLSAIPVVAGTPRVPVLALHTLGDLFVPFVMEQIYTRNAMANGAGDLVVQRAIRDAQHCGFSVAEIEIAFRDLVTWVETGTKPAGDDVLNPAVVGSPDFGCQFTTPVSGPGRPSAFFDLLPPPFPPVPACP